MALFFFINILIIDLNWEALAQRASCSDFADKAVYKKNNLCFCYNNCKQNNIFDGTTMGKNQGVLPVKTMLEIDW